MKDINWKSLVLEMLMVMTGVFLALFVDAWREDMQLAESVAATEQKIIEEIHSNYNQLSLQERRFNERYTLLISWGENIDESKSLSDQDGFPGIPINYLNDAAWQRANSSALTNYIDSDIISNAYALYRHNESLTKILDGLVALRLGEETWNRDSTYISYNALKSNFREAISQIAQSLESYSAFVDMYPIEM